MLNLNKATNLIPPDIQLRSAPPAELILKPFVVKHTYVSRIALSGRLILLEVVKEPCLPTLER